MDATGNQPPLRSDAATTTLCVPQPSQFSTNVIVHLPSSYTKLWHHLSLYPYSKVLVKWVLGQRVFAFPETEAKMTQLQLLRSSFSSFLNMSMMFAFSDSSGAFIPPVKYDRTVSKRHQIGPSAPSDASHLIPWTDLCPSLLKEFPNSISLYSG